jgi:phosphoribosylanthranilate isomerase
MPTQIKMCGITSVADAEACVVAGANAIGLNLIPESPRRVDLAVAREIVRLVADRATTILVVADLPVEQVLALLRETRATAAQLHGNEPPEVVMALLPHAFKAIRVGGPGDVLLADSYPGDDILVDAKVPGQLGGTGQEVDWDLVAPLAARRRLTLAGGLDPDNVARAVERVRPFRVDVASGIELGPGRKDPARVRAFVEAVRSC